MESNSWSAASQEQHHSGAMNRLHSEHKTKGASQNSIHIWLSRTALSSCHCLQDTSTEVMQDKLQWNELLLTHLEQEWIQLLQGILKLSQIKIKKRLTVPMPPTFNYMYSVTAVNVPMEPVSTFAPQTVTTRHLVIFCVPPRKWPHWNN